MASSRSRAARSKTKNDGLEDLTAEELRERARTQAITGVSHMRKADLVAALRSGRSTAGTRGRSGGTRSGAGSRSSGPGRPARSTRPARAASTSSSTSRRSTKRTSGTRRGEDYRGQTLVTRDHDVIRAWAEARGAVPATAGGRSSGQRPRVLRLNFPGYGGENLEEVSWEDWFATFDERDLDAVYQEHTSDGRPSNFFRLVREDV
jgi:hypothetical protein